MKDILRKTLVEKSDVLAHEWSQRLENLLPEWEKLRLKCYTQDLTNALYIYLLDEKLQVALGSIHKILREYFQSSRDGTNILIESLLINRYILLGYMHNHPESTADSLQIFGYLNDLFKVLVEAIQQSYHSTSVLEPMLQEYIPSTNLNFKALEFSGVGYVVIDTRQNIIFTSRGAERIYEIRSQEVIGEHIVKGLQAVNYEQKLLGGIEQAIHLGKETELYSIKQRVHNHSRILSFKIIPLYNTHEEINACCILMQDVTEQESRESELHRYEQYFENILNDAADAIILLNENDRIIMWNRAAESMFDYNEAEVIGKEICIIHPNTQTAQDELERMSLQVRVKGFVRNQRIEMITRSKQILLIEATRTAFRNSRDDFIGSSLIARDITQQEQLRKQVFQSEKLTAVGTLAAGIAHEVGSPLTSISSLSQILQMKTTDPWFKERLSLIQQSIDRISRTVRTLVDFSKPIAQKEENIHLNSVVENVIRILKYDKRLKRQEIITELTPELPLIRGSFDQVLQVFINTCLNAADAMEGLPEGQLTIRTWHKNKNVCASISDNGQGISEKDIPHIFEPFFTTKKSGKGTGLGLWVSYNIIQNLGGSIRVESKVNLGTTFTICIPELELKGAS